MSTPESTPTGSQSPVPSEEGYIPPPERVLPPSLADKIRKIPSESLQGPMDIHFKSVVGLLLHGQGLHYSDEFVSELADVAQTYMHELINGLHKFTEVQRRKRPSRTDVALLLRFEDIHPGDLYGQYEATLRFPNKGELAVVEGQIHATIESLSHEPAVEESDPLHAFFANEHYEITDLVPKQRRRPTYVPPYLPDLPPDYTYQTTSQYMAQVTDLKEIRLKLVEESRLTDHSLYDLIENDDRKWRKEIEDELNTADSDDDSIMSGRRGSIESPAHHEQPEVVEDQQEPTKAFDIEAYARLRVAIRQRRAAELALRRQRRADNLYIQAEELYSPYATQQPGAGDDARFDGLVSAEFRAVIGAVRAAERKKKKRLEHIRREKERREAERNHDQIEFGFNFNVANNISDSDSDDDHGAIVFEDEHQQIEIPTETLVEEEVDIDSDAFEDLEIPMPAPTDVAIGPLPQSDLDMEDI